jgi:hypothetical protein
MPDRPSMQCSRHVLDCTAFSAVAGKSQRPVRLSVSTLVTMNSTRKNNSPKMELYLRRLPPRSFLTGRLVDASAQNPVLRTNFKFTY